MRYNLTAPTAQWQKKHTLIFDVMKTVWKSVCILIVLTHQTNGKRSSKLSKSCPFSRLGAKCANVLSSETKMLIRGCSKRLNATIMEYHRLTGHIFKKLVKTLFYSTMSTQYVDYLPTLLSKYLVMINYQYIFLTFDFKVQIMIPQQYSLLKCNIIQ